MVQIIITNMSKVIQGFLNTYKNVFTIACKHKNIQYIPFPKYPINTDKLVTEYHQNLEKFIRQGKIENLKNYDFKKVPDQFPKKYFNYESA